MKRSHVSEARREFERATLRKLKAAGARPHELRRCRWLLTKGRKAPTDDFCDVLNKHSQEKAGIEVYMRALRGGPPVEQFIFCVRSVPDPNFNG